MVRSLPGDSFFREAGRAAGWVVNAGVGLCECWRGDCDCRCWTMSIVKGAGAVGIVKSVVQ